MFGILDLTDPDADTGDNSLLLCKFAAPMRVVSNQKVYSSDTLSLKRKRSKSAAQRWEIETSAIINGNRGADYFVKAITNGFTDPVLVRIPSPIKNHTGAVGMIRDGTISIEYPRAGVSGLTFSEGTAGLLSTVSANTTTFTVTLAPNSKLFKGDFFKFEGQDKIYMITNAVADTLNHQVTVDIFPATLAQVNAGVNMRLGKWAVMKALFETDTLLGMSYLDGILEDLGQIILVEAL